LCGGISVLERNLKILGFDVRYPGNLLPVAKPGLRQNSFGILKLSWVVRGKDRSPVSDGFRGLRPQGDAALCALFETRSIFGTALGTEHIEAV